MAYYNNRKYVDNKQAAVYAVCNALKAGDNFHVATEAAASEYGMGVYELRLAMSEHSAKIRRQKKLERNAKQYALNL